MKYKTLLLVQRDNASVDGCTVDLVDNFVYLGRMQSSLDY